MTNAIGRGWFLSALLAAAPCVSGCGAAPPETSGGAPTSATVDDGVRGTAGVHGKLLHAIAVNADHKVEFYELEHGATAAHESLLIGEPALLDGVTRPMTLAEIHRVVAPNAAVPQALVDAGTRAAAAAIVALEPEGGDQADSGGNAVAAKVAPASKHGGAAVATPEVTCSPDYNGDGWWGGSFLNNYCNEGGFRFCQQNWGDAYHWDQGSWFRWKQMEGDWIATGHTQGYRTWFPCSWPWACGSQSQIDWDYDVLPRHIEIWTYGDAGGSGSRRGTHGASGSSQCGHLHVAALWNN